jgi:hypothetical protein
MLKRINLQLLAEPAPAAANSGSGGTPPAAAAPAAPSAATATPPASVTFTADQLTEIDRITTERTTRASQAALKSYFQQQGMTEEQAATAITAYKTEQSKKMTPEAQAAIEAANTKASEALSQANTILIKADATVQAAALQIRADRLETVMSMADFKAVKVTDGKVDAAAVKTALEAVLTRFPEWKADPNKTPGFKVGAGDNTTGTDDAALRKAMGLPPAK